ncbi:epoxyqueuosine reductase QueH [uncultured Eubacterium sp.]|uniref:epoxyqueuosine reductase QueH n=1 Tax=uncultured Eubacterium sp. TaxID=165185 RepID=UPI0025FE10AC|nr:epoxyqueuosine reductase QueH [uncultured Eubacterium sp.]
MKQNYQKELEKKIQKLQMEQKVPTLLLHACCAPCSSYVLEYLAEYFHITVFFYNPNITDAAEYYKRVEEEKRLIQELPVKYPVSFIEGTYEPERFVAKVKGLEHVPEGGARCEKCFALRLAETAKLAQEETFDYFTTSLTISPLKNAALLNEVGEAMAAEYCHEDTAFLNSDFKKKNGYKRSVELSEIYGLYRQDYCGCVYSKLQREQEKRAKVQEET